MPRLPISLGYAHWFLRTMKTVRAIDQRLKAARWRKVDAHAQERSITLRSEIGDILIKQYQSIGTGDNCKFCGHTTLWSSFSLNDDVWAEAGLGQDDLAHAVCVAQALGRPLKPEDFAIAPCNDIAISMMPDVKPESILVRLPRSGD